MGAHHHHHDHGHHHGHHHHEHGGDTGAVSRLKWAFGLNVAFTFIELIGGIWSGSVAILADAIHDLGDSLALGLAIYLQGRSEQGPSPRFTYGMKRLSVLSAVGTGVLLVVGSLLVIKESVGRLLGRVPLEPHAEGMMLLALLGVTVNGVAAWRLARGRTHNEQLLSWHLLEDLLGWIAVLLGAVAIYIWQVTWLDPVLAIAIAGFVSWNAVKHLSLTSASLLQGVPRELKPEQIRERLLKIEGVRSVHDLHVWTLDGAQHVMSLHLVVDDLLRSVSLKSQARAVGREFGVVHTTVEIETAAENCGENCDPENP